MLQTVLELLEWCLLRTAQNWLGRVHTYRSLKLPEGELEIYQNGMTDQLHLGRHCSRSKTRYILYQKEQDKVIKLSVQLLCSYYPQVCYFYIRLYIYFQLFYIILLFYLISYSV